MLSCQECLCTAVWCGKLQACFHPPSTQGLAIIIPFLSFSFPTAGSWELLCITPLQPPQNSVFLTFPSLPFYFSSSKYKSTLAGHAPAAAPLSSPCPRAGSPLIPLCGKWGYKTPFLPRSSVKVWQQPPCAKLWAPGGSLGLVLASKCPPAASCRHGYGCAGGVPPTHKCLRNGLRCCQQLLISPTQYRACFCSLLQLCSTVQTQISPCHHWWRRLALFPSSLSGGLFMRGWSSPWATLDSPSRHRFLPPSGSWQDISYLSCTVVVGKGLVRGTPSASAAAAPLPASCVLPWWHPQAGGSGSKHPCWPLWTPG